MMINAASSEKEIIITFHKEMMYAKFVQDFLKRIETENILQKSCLSEENAQNLAEELKEEWWQKNRDSILKRIKD